MTTKRVGPLDFQSEMKKVVTSSPTVTLMVTRIPSTVTEEGVTNLFLDFTVLNLRLIVNKGGFAGVRGLNYAYVTVASNDEAIQAIGKLNMQPPLNLGVAYKPSEETRAKLREQDLLDRALGSAVKKEGESLYDEIELKSAEKVMGGQGSINEVSSVPSAEEVVDEAVFMFNSPLVITVMDKTLTACCCGAESTLVCSRCRTAAYCSQVCQVGEWARHKEECGGCEGAVELLGDKEKKGEVVKKRKLVRKQSAGQQDISDGTGSPRSTEDSPQLDTLSLESKESLVKAENQEIAQQLFPADDKCSDKMSTGTSEQVNDSNDLLALRSEESPAVEKSDFPKLRSSINISLPEKQEYFKETVEMESKSEGFKLNPPPLEKLDELMVEAAVVEDTNGVNISERQTDAVEKNNLDEVQPIVEQSSVDSDDESPPFQSFLMFKKQRDEKEVKSEVEICDSQEVNKNDIGSQLTPLRSSDVAVLTSSPVALVKTSDVKHLSTFTSPHPLPTSWTRVVKSIQAVSSEMIYVKIQGFDEDIPVRIAKVRLAEPWSGEIKKILEVVLGEGREGQVELWVKNVGWEGDVQMVDIKDEENNDIATLLTEIGVMEKIKDTIEDDEDFEVAEMSLSINEMFDEPVMQPEPLFVRDMERGLVVDMTLVRLRDIGDTSQEGLVRCMQEKERLWLEEVMELSDIRSSILSPQIGQLVAFVLQTRAGTKVARAEVIKLNESSQKAQCQCLDYHDRRWESYENLFQPPPACLSIPPLCVKVVLHGVIPVERKEAKLMLEQVDQASLSQPLTLHVKENGVDKQVVELLDAEGNSINEMLNKVLNKTEMKSESPQTVISSSLTPLDYSLLASYRPLPLNTIVPAIILHVESPTHLFVCPAACWEELNSFQTYLQTLAGKMEQDKDSAVQFVVGQLVMIRSEQDNLWYRGTVIKMYKTKVKVYCPDYGFVEKVMLSNMLPLTNVDVIEARYWASHCELVAWREGEQEATVMEVERIKRTLIVTQVVNLRVIEVDNVKFIIDIDNVSRK